MDLDQRKGAGMLLVDRGVHSLDERTLAGAASTPQQYIVSRQAGSESYGVVEKDVAHSVDPAQEADLDAVDLVHRLEPATVGMPHKSFAGVEVDGGRRGRGEPV